MNSTITDQIDQIEKPTCSAKIDHIRLRLAMSFPGGRPPVPSHASTSSESQCSMVRSRLMAIDVRVGHSAAVAPQCRIRQHRLTSGPPRSADRDLPPTRLGNDTETKSP